MLNDETKEQFERLARDNTFLRACLQCESFSEADALKTAITLLAVQNDALQKMLADATAIAPKRIRTPDGKVLRWDAPDGLVPIEDVC